MLIYVVIVMILAVLVYGVTSYRDLVQLRNDIAEARQDINTHIVKRHQALPQLMDWCRRHGIEERLVQDLESAMKKVHRVHHKSSPQDLGVAETELRRRLAELFRMLMLEGNRERVRDPEFTRLHKRITGLLIVIADRRERYNTLVEENNRRLQRRPDTWLADYCRFELMEGLQFQEEDICSPEHKGMYA